MLKLLNYIALLALVVLLLSVIGIAYLSSPPSRNPGQQQTTEQQEDENTSKGQHTGWGLIRFLFPDSMSIFNCLLVIATFCLFFVAIIQIGHLIKAEQIATKSADAAKDSADIAKKTLIATQRPWLSVNLEIGSGLVFDDQGCRIVIKFRIKNVGNSPAVAVHIWSEIVLNNEITNQKRVCALYGKDQIDLTQTFGGDIIFPNDEITYGINLPITRAAIDQARNEIAEAHNIPVDNFISPSVVGCVSYRFAFDGSLHKSGFIAGLSRLDPQHSCRRFAIDITAGDIPVHMLVLEKGFPIGWFAD
jgi:hypothetical protein